jgi:hypothetical protein
VPDPPNLEANVRSTFLAKATPVRGALHSPCLLQTRQTGEWQEITEENNSRRGCIANAMQNQAKKRKNTDKHTKNRF